MVVLSGYHDHDLHVQQQLAQQLAQRQQQSSPHHFPSTTVWVARLAVALTR
jgi:hypothetical protein